MRSAAAHRIKNCSIKKDAFVGVFFDSAAPAEAGDSQFWKALRSELPAQHPHWGLRTNIYHLYGRSVFWILDVCVRTGN